ncbi:MAG TPA: hypothetical protein VLX68_11530 [Chitinivibrionales bacterium]|nr:hypothetical protein [Chitinivibrionales bacterium]
MARFCILFLCFFGSLSAGILDTYYANGLSIEGQAFLGYVDRVVTRTDITTNPTDKTWLQYFDTRDNDRPNSFRLAIMYSRPVLSFLSLEAGAAVTHTDDDEFSRYYDLTNEVLTVNYIDLPVFAGVSLYYRFLKMFAVFASPALELNNQFFNYSYQATPPMSNEINNVQVKYQFSPGFVVRGGAEFIPWKIFGIALLFTYRNYSSEATDITVISNEKYREKITCPPCALGLKVSFYFQKKSR